ncbi:TonB-dependent receptor [Reichenbachiella agariperforans]|uniref:TonB-dependent receptor n=1 Tax=Reichenbachiella agariperforans TaxID=156994 RepID=UPI001C08E345|nr:TonB-dependent receptor plug domain-containing protein [Reichenbachiella agariperforans]MBU2914292.1 TonB-dependent receptor [Reichenbachiella agariperforans]
MRKLFLVIVVLIGCHCFHADAQNGNHSLRIVSNDDYDTPLYGAALYVDSLGKGVVSNISGHIATRDFPEGTYSCRVSFLGFDPVVRTLVFPLTEDVVIALDASTQELDGVTIEESAYRSVQMQQAKLSTIDVSALNLINVPRLLGEPDLIRMIQNLPGVKTETDFTGGFFVRGGRNDQNLILLDGVPVYNPWHLFGLFSAFNTEAIERVELTKGVFPAQYGSRLSSVLDIELQKGDTRNGAGYLTISPLSASFSYGRPINQKTSVLLSLRRTYLDPVFWVSDPILSTPDNSYKNRYNFFDFNFKLVHKFNAEHRLETGVFYGNDKLKAENTYTQTSYSLSSEESKPYSDNILNYGWRNITGSVKFITEKERYQSVSHLFTSWYQADNQYYYGDFNYLHENLDGQITTELYFDQHFKQYFTDYGAQQDFTFYLSDRVTLSTGGQWLYHVFTESNVFREQEYGYTGDRSDYWDAPPPSIELMLNKMNGDAAVTNSHEISGYVGAALELGKLSIYPGVRLQYFSQGQYLHLMPRVNMEYRVNKSLMLSAGYGHFTQYLQSLSLGFMRVPADRWFWSNELRPPALSKATTLGVGVTIPKVGLLSMEGYYKLQTGLLNFSLEQQAGAIQGDGLIPQFTQETISGEGEAYGIEFLLNRKIGDVTGWVGYTLSWAYNRFDEINGGLAFPSRLDKRHDIQTFVNWDFAKHWSLGLLFNFKSGQPLTFSTQYYLYRSDPLGIEDYHGNSQVIIKQNNYRLPAYHRLDLNLTWRDRKVFKRKSEISLNVINVYNHFNVLTITKGTSLDNLSNGSFRASSKNKYISQMPIMPVISLRIGLGKDQKWVD